MTDHLPECRHDGECVCSNPLCDRCICDRLRACEARVERVTREDDNRALWDNRQWNAALDAARDAVENLPVAITVVHDCVFLNTQGMGVCENPDDYPHGIVQVAALAAIDALRGAE